MTAPARSAPLSKVLTVSRLLGRGRCERADHLRHTELLTQVAPGAEAEPLVRGSVIHAGLAAACVRFPGEPDPDLVAAACVADAVERGLGATDSRLPTWTRVALRAARAADPGSWRPVRLPVASDGVGCGEGAGSAGDPATGLSGNDGAAFASTPAYADGADEGRGGAADDDGGGGGVLVERRLTVALPNGPSGELGRGWVFSFKPDAVFDHLGSGLRWLWDHKTKGEISRVVPWTELHLQALLYVGALRRLGVRCDGAVLWTVLADEPTVPALRKDGHLAERGWATDWPTACEVIRRSADPDPASPRYDALRRACAAREWQRPQEVLFSERELELAWDHLLACRDELVRSHAHAASKSLDMRLPVWRAVHPSGRGYACASCDYRAWCDEDFSGRDPEVLVGDIYRRGLDRYLAEVALTRTRTSLDYATHDDLRGLDTARARP